MMAATEGQGTKINLSMLIDFLLQKTYHELTVLAELLPRKTDIERKIEIVQFASRTRQQFVRLLALVKWASSAERVDKCQVISSYLDQQSMVFVDTADMLARMARETLVQARLPTFCLPAAVDVLTTGTYSRLPTCIRDKIVPPDPITTSEKTTTLEKLNQIIQHRLVTTDLPSQMSNISIGDGRVKFHVDHEFEVTLTIMGDDPSLPWRLLSIDILVQDIETGDGKPLVHDFQINYIHRLVQSRLFQEENAITDLYSCLHTFCLSLQLQVLYFQAKQLIHERWNDNIRIENNISEQTIVLHYWRNAIDQQSSTSTYKLKITYKSTNKPAFLRLQYEPEIKHHPDEDRMDVIPPGELYIEKVLIQTIKLQSNVKLSNLVNLLSDELKLNSKVLLDRKNSTLAIQTCDGVTPYEVLLITVDTRSGEFRVALGSGEENPICTAMEKALNANPMHFPVLLGDVRCQLHLCKCRSSVAMLPVLAMDHLPISLSTQYKLSRLGKHCIFFQFKNHQHYFLVVDVLSDEKSDKVIEQYYLLCTKSVSADNLDVVKKEEKGIKDIKQVKKEEEKISCKAKHDQSSTSQSLKPPLLFLDAEEMVDIGSTQIIDFPSLALRAMSTRNDDENSFKRKFEYNDEDQQSTKKHKTTRDLFQDCSSVSSFQAHLARLVSLCDSRIPLMPLCDELHQHQVIHDGVQSEAGVGLCIPILYLPSPSHCDSQLVSKLQETLLSCTVRFSGQDYRQCSFEMIFSACPFQSHAGKPEAKRVVLSYEYTQTNDNNKSSRSVVQQFLDDWCSMCKLYPHVMELELCLKDNTSPVRHMFHVGSYTYKQINLLYEPDRQNVVNIQWSVPDNQFTLSFCHGASSGASSPHYVMTEHLQKDFNKRLNLPYLMQILHETWKPLSSLNKLATLPQLGVISRSLTVQKNFSILPQSPTSVFLIYRQNVLEIHFKAKNLVSIRDAALSSVDPMKTKTSLSTISNLKTFLQQFVDDIAKAGGIPSRRGSEADDEIPPSPVNIDSEPPAMDIPFTSPQPMTSQNLTSSPIIPRVSPSSSAQSASSRAGFTPSPNPMNAPSPNNPYSSPSPAPFIGHSPHPYMQMMSPGSWSPLPGGSQVNKYRTTQQVTKQPPTPPRPLIAKSWASTSPTILSHTAFNRLCTPVRTQLRYDGNLSPLEMFLGTMFLKKHLCRAIQGDEMIQHLKTDASLVAFKTNNFNCIVKVDPSTYTSQRLAIKPSQENVWMHEELNILERFFETRVACAPYKANSLTSFARILTFPTNVLKDMIRIIRLEMNPDPSNKWRVEWCLTIPPNSPKMPFSIGTISVVFKTKLLIFIQLTRAVPQGTISYDSIVIPLVYDQTTNTTQQLPENTAKQTDVSRQATSTQTSSSVAAINAVLKKFMESPASKTGECTIFPTVLELARNLVLPPSSHMSGGVYTDSLT